MQHLAAKRRHAPDAASRLEDMHIDVARASVTSTSSFRADARDLSWIEGASAGLMVRQNNDDLVTVCVCRSGLERDLVVLARQRSARLATLLAVNMAEDECGHPAESA